jgi:hypothetical protein
MVCERSETVYRKTLLQIPSFLDAIDIQRFTRAPIAGIREIVIDPLMS